MGCLAAVSCRIYCWGTWTRTKNKRIRISRVANYTIPHRFQQKLGRPSTLAYLLQGCGKPQHPVAIDPVGDHGASTGGNDELFRAWRCHIASRAGSDDDDVDIPGPSIVYLTVSGQPTHRRSASLAILASVETLPSSSIDSNRGGLIRRPEMAVRRGPKARRGFNPSSSMSAPRSVASILS